MKYQLEKEYNTPSRDSYIIASKTFDDKVLTQIRDMVRLLRDSGFQSVSLDECIGRSSAGWRNINRSRYETVLRLAENEKVIDYGNRWVTR